MKEHVELQVAEKQWLHLDYPDRKVLLCYTYGPENVADSLKHASLSRQEGFSTANTMARVCRGE